MKYFYGPVQSRRLGFSLGVDICGEKQCSLDCVYCQVGRTPVVSAERFAAVDRNLFRKELSQVLADHPNLDYITFAGSGEPTLHRDFDLICADIKAIAVDKKIALITNSTLLTDADVRKEIVNIDLLVPSLDAARQETFERVNRPALGIDINSVVMALEQIKMSTNVQMWLEIMLIGGVNDSEDDLQALKDAVLRIKPDKVQINLPVRPTIDPVSFPEQSSVNRLITLIEDYVQVICDNKINDNASVSVNVEDDIIRYVSRRPALLEDLKALCSLDAVGLDLALDNLVQTKRVQVFEHQGKVFVKAYEIE